MSNPAPRPTERSRRPTAHALLPQARAPLLLAPQRKQLLGTGHIHGPQLPASRPDLAATAFLLHCQLLSQASSASTAFVPCTGLPHPPQAKGRLSQQASPTDRPGKRLGNSCTKSHFIYKSREMLLSKTKCHIGKAFSPLQCRDCSGDQF